MPRTLTYSIVTTTVLILGITLSILSTPVHAQTQGEVCNLYTPSVTTPTGYGASYNVFNQSELMLSIYCNEDKSVTVTAGNNDDLTYVYNQGYYYANNQWNNFTYTCTDETIADIWCTREATKTLTNTPTTGTTYLVSYTCQWRNNTWNCGCHNSACTTNHWQLQGWTIASGGGGTTPTGTGTYLNEDFENDWGSRYMLLGNQTRETGEAAHSGNYGVRMPVKAGEIRGGEIRYRMSQHHQGAQDEIWARYYIKYDANWSRDDFRGGKAGFRAHGDDPCGAPCLEMTDSFHFRDDGAGDIYGLSYWHKNISENTEAGLEPQRFQYQSKDWDASGDRKRGVWYCVETHIKLNTPGVSNGVYENWLDGQQVSKVTKARYRESSKYDIDNAVLITYVGGDWGADHDMDVYFDDWAVSDERIGCD